MTGTHYAIYHHKNPTFWEPEDDLINPHDFEWIAIIDAENLEDAFRLSNSIDTPWWHNAEVISLSDKAPGYRSTSVGDIIVEIPESVAVKDMTFWFVAVAGFKKAKFNVKLLMNFADEEPVN